MPNPNNDSHMENNNSQGPTNMETQDLPRDNAPHINLKETRPNNINIESNIAHGDDAPIENEEPASPIRHQDQDLLSPANRQGITNKELLSRAETILSQNPHDFEAYFQKATALYELGQKNEALFYFNKTIQLNPSDFESHLNKAIILKDLGKIEQSVDAFEHALKLNPVNYEAYYNKALLLADLNRKEEALINFNVAIEIDPEDPKGHNGKGVVLKSMGRNEEALQAFDAALDLNPNDHIAYTNKGNLLKLLGKNEEALQCYDKAIVSSPKKVRTLQKKATLLAELGREEQALELYDMALELEPVDSVTYSKKGLGLTALGRREEAIACLDKAIELTPDDFKLYNIKGNILHKLKKNEEAIVCYDKAIELEPTVAKSFYNKAIALEDLERKEEALEAYNKAIELDDSDGKSYYNKGALLRTMKRTHEALDCFNEAITRNDRDADAYHKKGTILRELKRKEEAVETLKMAVELDPSNAQAHYSLGHLLKGFDHFDEALKHFDDTINIDKNFEKAYAEKGEILMKLERWEEGAEAFTHAIDQDFTNTTYLYNRGVCLVMLPDRDQEAFLDLAKIQHLLEVDKIPNDLSPARIRFIEEPLDSIIHILRIALEMDNTVDELDQNAPGFKDYETSLKTIAEDREKAIMELIDAYEKDKDKQADRLKAQVSKIIRRYKALNEKKKKLALKVVDYKKDLMEVKDELMARVETHRHRFEKAIEGLSLKEDDQLKVQTYLETFISSFIDVYAMAMVARTKTVKLDDDNRVKVALSMIGSLYLLLREEPLDKKKSLEEFVVQKSFRKVLRKIRSISFEPMIFCDIVAGAARELIANKNKVNQILAPNELFLKKIQTYPNRLHGFLKKVEHHSLNEELYKEQYFGNIAATLGHKDAVTLMGLWAKDKVKVNSIKMSFYEFMLEELKEEAASPSKQGLASAMLAEVKEDQKQEEEKQKKKKGCNIF